MPNLITAGIALFFAWLFGTAAVRKIRRLKEYRSLMGRYLNSAPVGVASVGLVALVELCAALLLLAPQSRHAGLLLAAIMLLAYAGLMTLQLVRGRSDMKCGCAGPASDMTISPALVARNLACACLAGFAMLPVVTVQAGIAGPALVVFVATFTVLTYLGCEQLIANAQQMAGEG